MKDMIKFCMLKHEHEIRTLAKSPLGGQRFELLIKRWEMNNEPLPDEAKAEKPIENRGWPEGRALDMEEEDYFNADDDDEVIPSISQPWSRGPGALSPLPSPSNALKRKRRVAIGSGPKGHRPPLHTPLLGSLVDYEEDEDEDLLAPPTMKPTSSPTALRSPRSPSPELPPAGPKLSHRQVLPPPHPSSGPPPKRMLKDEDDEDNLLEALVRPKSRSESPTPRPPSPGPSTMLSMSSAGPLRPSEKRRRGDDGDDELMERLIKAKKPDLGMQKERSGFGGVGRAKNGDDPPKKIKVKFGATSLAVASSPSMPTPSETGVKDGDTG